jgi:HSP20 family molecular chaperone IbpA
MRVPGAERRAAEPAQFRMDVTENDKEYQILAEMPGVKKAAGLLSSGRV